MDLRECADLHCHTTFSDGSFSPSELVFHANNIGISAIAITDHDSIRGLFEAGEVAKETPLQIIPGVEISTEHEEKDVHILGYFFDSGDVEFIDFLEEQRRKRLARVEKMIQKLNDLGVALNLDDVLTQSNDSALGRPHVARAMLKKKIVSSWEEVFNKYIGRKAPAYVQRSLLSPHEAIDVIRMAKGVPVLAHPGISQCDKLIPSLIKSGLLGIECVYPMHSPSQTLEYLMLADNEGLIATGGSDCHGPDSKSGITLGTSLVGMDVVEKLCNEAKK